MITEVPVEMIVFLVISLLSLINRVLKISTNQNALKHIKKRIKKISERAEALITSDKKEDLHDMIENLVDLSENLIFAYTPRKPST